MPVGDALDVDATKEEPARAHRPGEGGRQAARLA
jgi:hypothetical protein